MKWIVIAAILAASFACGSSDDSSGFETGPPDGDAAILNDVMFQPLDVSAN